MSDDGLPPYVPSNVSNDYGFGRMNHDPFPSTLHPALEELTTQLVRLVSERLVKLKRHEQDRAYAAGRLGHPRFDDSRIRAVAESIAKLCDALPYDFAE